MEIHWVGGNLPHVGKAWTVRALTEGLFIQNPQILPVVVDTGPSCCLSQIYNPGLLASYTPSNYFTSDLLASDEIMEIAHTYKVLVVKLSSYSQAAFLNWVEDSGILDQDIRHNFWFVSNGNRRSLEYFGQLGRNNWSLNFVRNQHQQTWGEVEPESEESPFHIRTLSGIISNPTEIELIESSGATLLELSQPEALYVPLLTRIRIQRFLKYNCDFLLTATPQQQLTSIVTPELVSIEPRCEEEDEDIPF